MQQQPESPSSTLSVSPAPVPGLVSDPAPDAPPQPEPASPAHHPHHVPRWLVRLELFLRVMLQIYIGLFVCYAPWSHTLWDQNPFILQFPRLANIAAIGAVRGMVSGIGLLNLWIAFYDAIRHRDG